MGDEGLMFIERNLAQKPKFLIPSPYRLLEEAGKAEE